MVMQVKDVVDSCTTLKTSWQVRNNKMKDWYNILRLEDKLAQKGMETVTANDPKTGYLLGKHLLTSSTVAHKIEIEELDPTEIAGTSYLEKFMTRRWVAEENRYRRMGRQSFKGQLLGFMLATGWYAAFSMVTEDRIWTEVMNPYDVYPKFGPAGIDEAAHIYELGKLTAMRKCKLMGWNTPPRLPAKVAIYNYWFYDSDGDIANGIVMDRYFVKEPVKDVALNNLIQKLGEPMFPIFMSPVGGLPDEGSILQSPTEWQKNFGESIVATNESLTNNYNKMLSFAQHATRGAAQHRWYEKVAGDYHILKEEDMDKWGAIFSMGPNDEIGALTPPQIPVELRTIMFEYTNMLQRGLFPAALHGNIQQQMSFLAMANVASSAIQILTPFRDNYVGLMSDLNNYHYNMMKVNGYRPHNFKMPEVLPDEFAFQVQADIEIPGFLIQRATIARMLDPTFRLPTRMVMDKFFPEIKDPIGAIAESRKDEAMMHPKAILADAVIAYKEHARRLKEAGQSEAGALYDKLAASTEAEIVGGPVQPRGGGNLAAQAAEASVINEAFPGGAAQRPQEGLGQV